MLINNLLKYISTLLKIFSRFAVIHVSNSFTFGKINGKRQNRETCSSRPRIIKFYRNNLGVPT